MQPSPHLRGPALLLALASAGPALAGVGPWVVAQGDRSVYVGVDSQSFREVAGASDFGDTTPVGEGVSSFGLVGIGTYGLLPDVELSVMVPWARVRANDPTSGLCARLGPPACRTTQGFGTLSFAAKGLLLDELAGAPLTVSLAPELRIGTFTADTRDRLTNLGEGTTDLGAGLALGKSGGLGAGYWSAALEGGWRYRIPNRRDYPGPDGALAVPGPELTGAVEALFTPRRRVTFGPSAVALVRPRGVNIADIEGTGLDDWGALRVASVAAGAKLIVRNEAGVAANVGVFRTAWAMNNPADNLSISAGVSIRNPGRRASAP